MTTAVSYAGLSRLKLFLALSRTTHGVLDMATPALGAMLWLGHAPSLPIVLLGLLTAFAGYTAVYALNDVVDYRIDRERVGRSTFTQSGNDLDTLCVRHPLAQGLLTLQEGILWTAAWGGLALLGAYMLDPRCAYIFMAGCLAEAVYCLMLRVSYLRTLVSGTVKTAGGLAAVFAVAPDPSPAFVVLLFLWLFVWEIGGQNVPNDWADVTEDRDLDAETIPLHFGTQKAARLILAAMGMSVALSLLLYFATPAPIGPLYLLGALAAGTGLLLLPAYRLHTSQNSRDAASLFNRASYYPVAMLMVVMIS